MSQKLTIKRYNAYYQGWCLSFGEHEADIEEDRSIYWLTGDKRFGLAIEPSLRRKLNMSFLGQQGKNAELILQDDSLKVEEDIIYQLTDQVDIEGMNNLKKFLSSHDTFYLFLTNHFCYPQGTKIITFSTEKPTILLYKEMSPLKVLIT